MFNVCLGCGEYDDKKIVENVSDQAYAVCQQCSYRQPFLRLPFFSITGASGTGKTAISVRLASSTAHCVCLDSDILWRDDFANANDNYRSYRNMWLRLAKNISQNGRPVALFGTATPGQFEDCAESRYFKSINYLALVCEESQLVERLKARPSWRNSSGTDTVAAMIKYNKWLMDNAKNTVPEMAIIDTSKMTLDESVNATREWLNSQITKADCANSRNLASGPG